MPSPAITPIHNISPPSFDNEGLGERLSDSVRAVHPHPTLPLEGEGFSKRMGLLHFLPLPLEGEAGWGCSTLAWTLGIRLAPPPLTPPRWGGGLRRVVFEPIVTVCGKGEGFCDPQNRAIGVAQNIIVPEADDHVTVCFDQPRPRDVSLAIRVLPAIDFDHQFGAAAGKISDEATNRELASELNAQLFSPQSRPQSLGRFGRFAPQFLCYGRQAFRYHWHTFAKLSLRWRGIPCSIGRFTPTQPSPLRGRALRVAV